MSDLPWLVIGLGNPEPAHAGQRHNVGFDVIRVLTSRLGTALGRYRGPARLARSNWQGRDLLLAEPRTYMNESGIAGAHLTRTLGVGLDHVLVVYDDLDLPVGRLRVRASGSPGGHNGIRSLQTHWRSKDFARVRVGIGRPPAGVDPIEYVLGSPRGAERERLEAAVARAADAVLAAVGSGLEEAMSTFNRSEAEPPPAPEVADG
ncbi:MAG: aminoacyl-tRNA hydrolase [Candidatus Dormibacteria bacterium]